MIKGVRSPRGKLTYDFNIKSIDKLIDSPIQYTKTQSQQYRSDTTSTSRICSSPRILQASSQLGEENKRIKVKVKEYVNTLKPIDKEVLSNQEENLIEKLKDQADKINDLLSKDSSIKTLIPYKKEVANASLNTPYNARLKCKECPLHLTISIEVNQGIGCSYLYLSFINKRPNRYKCCKAVLLVEKKQIIVFSEEYKGKETFTHDWIYIGLETAKECSIYFTCSFGKGKELYKGRKNIKI